MKKIFSRKSIGYKLLSGSLAGFIIKIAYMALQFSVAVFLARLLGPESLGTYVLAMTLVQLISIFCQCGFPSFLVRLISSEKNEKTKDVKHALLTANLFVLSASFAVIFFYFFISIFIHKSLTLGSLSDNYIAIFLIPIISFITVFGGALRGFGAVVLSQLPQQIFRPAFFLSFLVVIYFGNFSFSVNSLLMGQVFSAGIALLFGMYLLKKKMHGFLCEINTGVDYVKWIKCSFPFMLLSSTQVLSQHADVVMLGLLSEESSVGVYKVSLQISEVIFIPLLAVAIVIGPMIAKLHSNGDFSLLSNLVRACHQISFVMLFPVCLLLYLYSEEALRFVFGAAYLDGASTLVILAVGKLVYSMIGFTGLVLSMIGRPGVASIIAFLTLGINVSLNLILIPFYDTDGAALATIFSQFLVNFLGVFWVVKELGFNVSGFGKIFSFKSLKVSV